MKSNTGRFITIVAICLGLMISLNVTFADAQSLDELSAEWWQWAVSIPTSVNPQTDKTGEDCMVGQRGATWFLGGVFGGGRGTRTCSIPQGTMLFFPVINAVNVNSPNVCGQDAKDIPVATLRAQIAPFIDDATKLSVKVDNKEVKSLLQRVKSTVFEVALPGDNVFDAVCGGPGSVPAGIYSPAVADGFYVDLPPLTVGKHTISFHAEDKENPSFVEDVTYNLTVVPVSLQ